MILMEIWIWGYIGTRVGDRFYIYNNEKIISLQTKQVAEIILLDTLMVHWLLEIMIMMVT